MSEPKAQPLAEIPSPCAGVCKIPQDDPYCLGCLRTREEIKSWRSADRDWRLATLELLKERREKIWGVKPRKRTSRRTKATNQST